QPPLHLLHLALPLPPTPPSSSPTTTSTITITGAARWRLLIGPCSSRVNVPVYPSSSLLATSSTCLSRDLDAPVNASPRCALPAQCIPIYLHCCFTIRSSRGTISTISSTVSSSSSINSTISTISTISTLSSRNIKVPDYTTTLTFPSRFPSPSSLSPCTHIHIPHNPPCSITTTTTITTLPTKITTPLILRRRFGPVLLLRVRPKLQERGEQRGICILTPMGKGHGRLVTLAESGITMATHGRAEMGRGGGGGVLTRQ
ncbi:unnamed protein product, partial [Closterium sp. NIES-54]